MLDGTHVEGDVFCDERVPDEMIVTMVTVVWVMMRVMVTMVIIVRVMVTMVIIVSDGDHGDK